jgi:hypothetical protein
MFPTVPTSWRWCLWLLYVVAWTTALLVPVPTQEAHWTIADLQVDVKFLFAKMVHISAYAVLAGLTGWVRAPMRLRFLLMFFVMAHASTTELLQYWLEFLGRSGELFDVGLDHCGIALGTLLTWKWWTAAETDKPQAA